MFPSERRIMPPLLARGPEEEQICAVVNALVRFNKIRNLNPAVLRGVGITYRKQDTFDDEFFEKAASLINAMDYFGRIRCP